MTLKAVHPDWAHVHIPDAGDIVEARISLDGEILALATQDKVDFRWKNGKLVSISGIGNDHSYATGQWALPRIWVSYSPGLISVFHVQDSGYGRSELRFSEAIDQQLVFPDEEAGVVFAVTTNSAELLQIDISPDGFAKVKRRWLLDGIHVHSGSSFQVLRGCLYMTNLDGQTYKWHLVPTVDKITAEEALALPEYCSANNNEATTTDLLQILGYDMYICRSSGRIVVIGETIEAILSRYVDHAFGEKLCEINGWDQNMFNVAKLQKAIHYHSVVGVRQTLHALQTSLPSLTKAMLDSVGKILACGLPVLAVDSFTLACAETFLMDAIVLHSNEACGRSLASLRSSRIAYEDIRKQTKDGSTQFALPQEAPEIVFALEKGWHIGSLKEQADIEDIDEQRTRKALGRRWNSWARLSDTQVVLDAVEKNVIASGCAFLNARHGPSFDSMSFIRTCVQSRAMQLLCDFQRVEHLYTKTGMDIMQFYRDVALTTYNRTLRRQVVYHVTRCRRSGAVLPLDASKAEEYLSDLEARYPCKSHPVALRRYWSTRFAMLQKSPDKQTSYFDLRSEDGSIDNAETEILNYSLHVPLVSNAVDGDDERCVETVCSSCKSIQDIVSMSRSRRGDQEFQASSDNDREPFAAFLRFSLQVIMAADDETKWRVFQESVLEKSLDSVQTPPSEHVLFTFLADHNEWRGLRKWISQSEERARQLLRDQHSTLSAFLQLLLHHELSISMSEGSDSLKLISMKFANGLTPAYDAMQKLRSVEQLVQLAQTGAIDAFRCILDDEAVRALVHDPSRIAAIGTLSGLVYVRPCIRQVMGSEAVFQAFLSLGIDGLFAKFSEKEILALRCMGEWPNHDGSRDLSFAKALPELYLAITTETDREKCDPNESGCSSRFYREMALVAQRYFDLDDFHTLIEEIRVVPQPSLTFDAAYFLRQRRPISALQAITETLGAKEAALLARSVALDVPHDSSVLESCCAFIQMHSNVDASQEIEALKVDVLALSHILLFSNVVLEDEAELKKLFITLRHENSQSSVVRALTLLLNTLEKSGEDIGALPFRFCRVHNLPGSLLMLNNLSKRADILTVLGASERALSSSVSQLTGFFENDPYLQAHERVLALRALGVEWDRLVATTLPSDPLLDILLRSELTSQQVLDIARRTYDVRLVAFATALEGCNFAEAWRVCLLILLRGVLVVNSADDVREVLAACFDNIEMRSISDILERSACAFQARLPVLSEIVLFALDACNGCRAIRGPVQRTGIDTRDSSFGLSVLGGILQHRSISLENAVRIAQEMQRSYLASEIGDQLLKQLLFTKSYEKRLDNIINVQEIARDVFVKKEKDAFLHRLLANDMFDLAYQCVQVLGESNRNLLTTVCLAECAKFISRVMSPGKSCDDGLAQRLYERAVEKQCDLSMFLRSLLFDSFTDWSPKARALLGVRLTESLGESCSIHVRRALTVAFEHGVDITHSTLTTWDSEPNNNARDLVRMLLHRLQISGAAHVAIACNGGALEQFKLEFGVQPTVAEWTSLLICTSNGTIDEIPGEMLSLINSSGWSTKDNMGDSNISRLLRANNTLGGLGLLDQMHFDHLIERCFQALSSEASAGFIQHLDIVTLWLTSRGIPHRAIAALVEKSLSIAQRRDVLDSVLLTLGRPLALVLFEEYASDPVLILFALYSAELYAKSPRKLAQAHGYLARFVQDASEDALVELLLLQSSIIAFERLDDSVKECLRRLAQKGMIKHLCKRLEQSRCNIVMEMLKNHFFGPEAEEASLVDQVCIATTFPELELKLALALERRGQNIADQDGDEVTWRQCLLESKRLYLKHGDDNGVKRVDDLHAHYLRSRLIG